MDWHLLSKSDQRSAVSRKHLESAVTEAVKSVLDCEAFVGVIIQRIEPKSRTDPNWAVRGVRRMAEILISVFVRSGLTTGAADPQNREEPHSCQEVLAACYSIILSVRHGLASFEQVGRAKCCLAQAFGVGSH